MAKIKKKNKEKNIAFGLLDNGLDFIMSALNHLKNPKEADLKYAVLHLSAGVDLILKYRLSKEHWSLLFEKIDQANMNIFESGKFTSVNSNTCIDRLKGICSVDIDEENIMKLKMLRERRNRLEHFGIVESESALKSSTAAVLGFLLDFIDQHVNIEELESNERELLDNIRSSSSDFRAFVEKRMKSIKKDLEDYGERTSITYCPTCLMPTLVINSPVKCMFCGYSGDGPIVACDFISNVLHIEKHSAVKDGEVYPLYHCPECVEMSLVDATEDHDVKTWICFSCGKEWRDSDIDICNYCGNPFTAKSERVGICNDCFDEQLEDD